MIFQIYTSYGAYDLFFMVQRGLFMLEKSIYTKMICPFVRTYVQYILLEKPVPPGRNILGK